MIDSELEWVNKYVGIPFDMEGDTLDGCNCWTLIRLIYKARRNIELPTFNEYFPRINKGSAKKLMRAVNLEKNNHWEPVAIPKLYDVVFMRTLDNPVHVAMMIDEANALNMLMGPASVVDRIDSAVFNNRILGIYAYVG